MGARPAARGGGGDAVERAPLLALLEAELAAAEAFAPRSAPALLRRRTLKARRAAIARANARYCRHAALGAPRNQPRGRATGLSANKVVRRPRRMR
jgi:hypothetical protein